VSSRKDLFLRNTALNFTGLALPLLLAFLVMPVISRNLGAARFGLLGLAWALLEYFSLLDVGLGRATTKFVAERVADRPPELVEIITVSVLSQTLTGILGGALLALLTPLLVGHVLTVPTALEPEARRVLLLLSATLPLVLLSLSLRGIVEAAQRFDLSNMIRIASSSATFLIPAIGAARGVSLPVIVLLLLVTRMATCVALAAAVPFALPGLVWRWPHEWRFLRQLLAYGGWVAVSNVLSPVLIYLDRFMLAAVAGIAAVGYYTAPYEATTRLLIIPASLVTTLFPLVSALGARNENGALSRMFTASLRNLVLVLAAPVAAILVFAPDLLTLWLGPEFSAQSAPAMRVLAIGLLVNGLAHVPYSYIQALGRPDIPAKFHVLELIVYPPMAWLLIRNFGITGAAAAWSVRALGDAILLFAAAGRLLRLSPRRMLGQRAGRLVIAVTSLALVLIAAHVLPFGAAVLIATATLAAFATAAWHYVLEVDEREIVGRLLSRFVAVGAPR
jgi:O-antigen/teichoic acid export membrane protein